MDNKPEHITQSNYGSMAGGMQAAIGNKNLQTMTSVTASKEEVITQTEVIELLGKLEEMIGAADFPKEIESIKEEAGLYVQSAKKAAEKKSANKELIKVNLDEIATNLEKASKTFDGVEKLWSKVKPILGKIVTWLGAVAAGSFIANL